MKAFDYTLLAKQRWDTEVMNYTNLIHEYKGKQDLYLRQKPVELERLVDIAKIQSTESSNRIEGIVTTASRIQALVTEKTTPRNRGESEIAGYRDVLNTIHENYAYIPLQSNYILQLHRDLMQYTGNPGGVYKNAQNYLQETKPDGTTFIRFTPVPPFETEPSVIAICDSYRKVTEQRLVDPLLVIPVFIADFLCIHPFCDGNGRMSRLLTLLLLYQSGYQVGKYISMEKHIEKTKDAYYDALERASYGWHEGQEDSEPFIKYMLGVILACCREFEERVDVLHQPGRNGKVPVKSSAIDIVRAAVKSRVGGFTKTEILNICPTISRSSVESGLRELIATGEIQKFGNGKSTYYLRSDAAVFPSQDV
ncbi:MAG: Fic family protein [Clostridia bacterium]|nr:Fic family protein [Clostridia bacterium]